jgi:two-component system chemotaxis response regulator CheB
METKNIIVVGASAGGVKALVDFVGSLPGDLNASVFVVLHIPAYSRSQLPAILSKAGLLQAVHPSDGEKIKPGIIYVAPNDHHLLIEGNRVLVKKGPKENGFRPSVDALFRSAAVSFGSHVIGVVLSGLLNDGTSGLWSVKRQGGVAVIQSPHDADFPDMPRNVLDYVEVDFSVPVVEMGDLIQSLLEKPANVVSTITEREMKRLKMEVIIATRDNAFEMGIMEMGELTPFTCPECHGALVRLVEGSLIRFRCHTGHAFTASSLLANLTKSIEETLWAGMRGLEEATMLLNGIADHFEKLQNHEASALFIKKAKSTTDQAQIIHDTVFRIEQYSEDLRFEKENVLE